MQLFILLQIFFKSFYQPWGSGILLWGLFLLILQDPTPSSDLHRKVLVLTRNACSIASVYSGILHSELLQEEDRKDESGRFDHKQDFFEGGKAILSSDISSSKIIITILVLQCNPGFCFSSQFTSLYFFFFPTAYPNQ